MPRQLAGCYLGKTSHASWRAIYPFRQTLGHNLGTMQVKSFFWAVLMYDERKVAFKKAMSQARKLEKLAKIPDRKAMQPHVRKWSDQMKIVLGGNHGR